MAQAAARARDRLAHVEALEQALAIAEPAVAQPLFTVDADALWAAYDELAQHEGNRARLLVGDDAAWMQRARQYPCRDRLMARAFYAFLSHHARDIEVRTTAHDWLAYTLFADGRPNTAQALYTRSARFATLADIPAVARYRLADKALAEFNVKLAAELVRDLEAPPPDDDSELWTLRRARMLIYADDVTPGVALLRAEFAAREQISADLADRYLQVLFDLQTLGRHTEANELLAQLYRRVEPAPLKREILFWQADSLAALGQHQAAAELYLRSATFDGASGRDPWGETARFRAAEQLGKAGLIDDARNIYGALLAQAQDPRRRVQIERHMQQLWLVRRTPAVP
jgi:tetratricopeptide (TPR) repeat protein